MHSVYDKITNIEDTKNKIEYCQKQLIEKTRSASQVGVKFFRKVLLLKQEAKIAASTFASFTCNKLWTAADSSRQLAFLKMSISNEYRLRVNKIIFRDLQNGDCRLTIARVYFTCLYWNSCLFSGSNFACVQRNPCSQSPLSSFFTLSRYLCISPFRISTAIYKFFTKYVENCFSPISLRSWSTIDIKKEL